MSLMRGDTRGSASTCKRSYCICQTRPRSERVKSSCLLLICVTLCRHTHVVATLTSRAQRMIRHRGCGENMHNSIIFSMLACRC